MKHLSAFFIAFVLVAAFFTALVTAMQSQSEVDKNSWTHSGAIDGVSGVASRPIVTDMSVTFSNGTTKTLLSGLTTPEAIYSYESKKFFVVPVVSPTNLCIPGQSGGQCYTTPNRIQVYFNCISSQPRNDGRNDMNTTDCTEFVDATFDVTINMKSYSSRIEWYYMTGGLEYYSYDEDTKVLRVKAKAQDSDIYNDPTGSNCCTCNPPSNCDVNTPKGIVNNVEFMISVGTGDPSFRYAFFATQWAWMGFMDLTGKTLNYYLTGASKRPDGTTLTKASMNAFIPQNTLKRVFPSLNGQLNSDRLNVTRNGQLIQNTNTLSWSKMPQGQFGTSGLMLKIDDITFSVPVYGVQALSAGAQMSVIAFIAMMVVSMLL